MNRTYPTRARGAAAAGRACPRALLLAALLVGLSAGASAQSGRRSPKPVGVPTESPKQGEPAARPEAKRPEAAVHLVVIRSDEGSVFGYDPLARDGVAAAFIRRLGQSAAVDVKDGGKGRRSDARDRAKKEEKAYVVLFMLEEQGASMTAGQVDSRTLVLRTFVYTPKVGDLKYTDVIYQRPYQDTARVGGVRIPVPTRRMERYPSQRELEQAARDAADRLLGRFELSPPTTEN